MSLLSALKKHIGVISITLIYIFINMIFTLKGIYYLNLLPIIAFIVLIALVRLNYLFFLIIIFTPLSILFIEYVPSSPIDFAIPTEPMIFGVMIIVIYKILLEKNLDLRILRHPVTYAIIFNLLWIFITSLTSSMPMVSLKFLLARIWFLITFYLLAIYIFRKTSNITNFIWAYTLPMIVVVFYTINRHLTYGLFDKEAAHFVMTPFFRDHTSYGAVSAMLFFALLSVVIKRNKSLFVTIICWGAFIIITSALVLSYARAAWMSVFLAIGVMTVTIFKIKFKYVALLSVLAILYFGGKRIDIIHKMEQNQHASSADFNKQIKSISNIKTDASNVERLNRWSSAFRMFKERPFFGWGPGTYMFKYAPFQLADFKSTISTNFGDKGNAHSEYFGPLAEEGVFGTLSFISIAVFSLITGFKVYHKIKNKDLKFIVLGLILGLITYLIHGCLNNFLDTDKVSALFWGFIAVFVSLDIYYLPKEKESVFVPNKEGDIN
jgi:putative inorganic carbon (HCO3(-)) transporter